MGGKAKSFEDEAMDALNSAGDDEALAAEAGSVLRPSAAQPQSMFVEPDPSMKAPDARGVLEQLVDPSGAVGQGLADGKSMTQIDTERNGGVSPIERMAEAAVGAGSPAYDKLGAGLKYGAGIAHGALGAGIQHYRDDPNHGVLEALIAAKDAGLTAAAVGATGATLGGAGGLLQSGADKARAAAFNAGKDDLQAMGVTPREFAQRTDELGLNNRVLPMDATDKRARIQGVLADRGALHDEALASADASNPLAGRDMNAEIARDIDQNADRVWTGRSNQREPITSAMRKTADAIDQGDPINSLAELARYRTQQGGQAFGKFGSLPDAASGKGALAGYDSADQHLTQAMSASGDENFQKFTAADNDFHDAKLLEELTNQAPPSNPWRRAVGATVGGAVGAAVGGGYPGMAAGAAIGDMTRGYHADAAANLLGPIAGGMSGAGSLMQSAAPAAGMARSEQLQQLQGQSRGQQQPDVVEQWVNQGNPILGPWMQQLQQAQQNGTLDQELSKLRQTDDRWRATVLPQLQQSTSM